MVDVLTTEAKILSKSTPNFWVFPSATRRALNFSIDPSFLRLTVKSHVIPSGGSLLAARSSEARIYGFHLPSAISSTIRGSE